MTVPASVLRFHHFGDPGEVLQLEEETLPAPGPGEARLRIAYTPVHPSDLNLIEGSYGTLPVLPAVPGGEASAEVEAVGEGVDTLAPGDRVILMRRVGSWRSRLNLAASDCFRLPAELDMQQAAMIAINPATALRLLKDLVPLPAGAWVVQNAANSAVGLSVVQLAKSLGLRTLNLARDETGLAAVRRAGGTLALRDEEASLDAAREAFDGEAPHLGLNAVGGPSALRLMNLLAPGGTLVTYGAMGKRALKVPNSLLIFRDLRLRGFWLSQWNESAPAEERRALLGELAEEVSAGRLHIPVAGSFGMHQFDEALREAARGGRDGKILLAPEHPPSTAP